MVDRDIVRTESGWLVWCAECNTRFESKRNDAAYCSATCRSRVHRREKLRLETINQAKYYARAVIVNTPRRGNSEEFKALCDLKAMIDRAIAAVESD